MKILVLSFYYPPDLCAGSFRMEAFIPKLQSAIPHDAEIHIVTTMPNRYKDFKKSALSYEASKNIIIHRIELPEHQSGLIDQSKAFLIYAMNAIKIIKSQKYDLVFATSSRLMTAFLGAVISKFKSIDLYLDIRDLFLDTIQDVFSRKAKMVLPLFSLIEKFTFNQAKKINLVSEGFKPYFDKKYPNKKLSFYTNGIDEHFLNFNFNKVDTDRKMIKVLYAGNIGEGQGLHNILPEICTKLKDRIQIKVIGNGGRKAKLLESFASLNLKNIEFCEPVDREMLLFEYKEADVLFLHLNNFSAFEKVLPSKLFEYAATGKPIWAGLSGYSYQFSKNNIDNIALFSPCNSSEAISAFNSLNLNHINRKDFVDRFSRNQIMYKLAEDVVHRAEHA